MICGRCDKPILPDEEFTLYDIARPSGPGTTVYRHVELCKRVPIQTTQQLIRH